MTDTTVQLDSTPTRQRIAGWRDYVSLMKPRVMSLVVFTAIVGLVCAPVDMNPLLAAASILAITFGAGAAGALNMWWDSDIDAKMKRTRSRPVPAGLVPRDEALGLGLVMAVLSVVTLLLASNIAAAGLLAFTIFFYAVPYSMWLKRATPQNIVIGGLAGALPPAVAWAAATGSLTLDPLLLVAIIFIWTPPHFWALALYKVQDYEQAGIPMMPNVAGVASTRRQILGYSLLLAPLGVAPVLTGLGGVAYAVVSIATGALFVLLAVRVARSNAGEVDGRGEGKALYEGGVDNRPARDLFAFSLLYLTLVFATLLLEHGFGLYQPLPWSL